MHTKLRYTVQFIDLLIYSYKYIIHYMLRFVISFSEFITNLS